MLTRNAASLARDTPHGDLLSAVTLPTGGLVCVDLLRPHVPLQLFLGRDELADEMVWHLAQAFDNGADDLALPDPWVRLLVVNGVDRWFEDEVDETLLAADRALALYEIGDTQGAHALFASTDLRFRLTGFANEVATRIANSRVDGDDPVVTELLRILDAAPHDMRSYTTAAREVRAAVGGTDTDLWAFAASGTLCDDADLDNLASRAGLGMAMAAVDRLRVPARLIRGFQVGYHARYGEDFVDIACAPFPGITRDHPAASRLLVRVFAPSGRILSAGALEFDDDGMFAARLPLKGHTLDAVTVDVYDALGLAEPRIGPSTASARHVLAQAQRAFTDLRIAGGRAALGYPDAAESVRAADTALAALADDYRHKVATRSGGLIGTGAVRPLLSELHAAALDRSTLTGDRPQAGTASEASRSGSDTVVSLHSNRSWTVSPRVPRTRAAASTDATTESFTASHLEWGLIYTQTPTSGHDAVLEIRVNTDLAAPLDLVRVTVGEDDRLLVLRARHGALVATVNVRGAHAWGDNAVTVFRPIAATDLPQEDIALVGDAVRRAPISEQNLWRKIRSNLAADHPVATTITESLR